MKIIKKGKVSLFRAVCKDCGCEFEFNKTEFNKIDTTFSISCPTCGRKIFLGSDEVQYFGKVEI